MKKPTSKTSQRRKLVLRSETLIELTRVQLTKVAGGWTWDDGWPCGGASQQDQLCTNDTIDPEI
jgi:hypothetical protein